MSDLARILDGVSDGLGLSAVVWIQRREAAGAEVAAATGGDLTPPDPAAIPVDGAPILRGAAVGRQLIARLPGRTRAWLALGPVRDEGETRRWMRVLVPAVAEVIQAQWESRRAADELAERYEEINLLYSISEILGRTITFEEAARTILLEVAETVGAEYGALFRHDAASGLLVPVTALRVSRTLEPKRIPVDHPVSVPARVFRTRRALLVDDGVLVSEFEAPFREGALLAVPILWTTPEGGLPVGVVCLSGRRHGASFTAGDEKLVAAIGSQIGSVIQNGILVRRSIEQERLASEMRLAHDLQLKLLPSGTEVAPEALCAARVEAAEGVGGDFYHLFRLEGGRTGVLVGDVSGHGYRAALIMALVMSAAAIHARGEHDPARTVEALLATVADELADTEMFLSLCYAVVDPDAGAIRWTNTGHPHAFVIARDGTVHRLEATDPPLGLGPATLRVQERPWDVQGDLLAIFTDGVSDARDTGGHPLGEAKVLEVLRARRAEVPSRIIDGVFAQVTGHMGRARPHDDQAVVVAQRLSDPASMTGLPRPKKRFGQHFLTDPALLGRIADALGATGADTVIEIGPGRGALTAPLLARAGRVIAIEVDRELSALLRTRYAAEPRFALVEGDVLEQDLGALAGGPFLLAGNVPYNITTPILFHALRRPRPARAVYLVQLEVAARAVARPGEAAYGALSVNLQAVADIVRCFTVGARAFTPPPKVESAVIRVTPRAEPVIAETEEAAFRTLVQGAFGLRRKQLRRVVRTLWSLDAAAAEAVLERAGLDGARRPETLSPAEFARLLRAR